MRWAIVSKSLARLLTPIPDASGHALFIHQLLDKIVFMILIRFFRIALLACGLTIWSQAVAQPAGAKGDDFLYRVVQGDTLGELARRYTTSSSNWSVLQRLNGIEDPYRLPIAKLLHIPFSMIPTRESTARVLHVFGVVRADGRALAADSSVAQGQTIETGSNGFVALILSDDSVVSIPPSSTVIVQRLQEFIGAGLTDSILQTKAGSVETQVAPNDTGVGRFEVRTPVSVTGVRGTRLRVHVADDGSRSEVVSGMAGVDGSASSEIILREQQGMAIGPEGQSSGVRRLLPAPQLSAPARGPGGWMAIFEPVEGASSYMVSVAKDPEGGQLVSRKKIAAPPVSFAASAPGTHYVFVRAIDEAGVGGMDARQEFEGAFVLMDGAGGPILAGSGHPITVADY